ncbi:hypothetical protein R1sor_017557 [Riccia sorocarpa]|uniref:Uncharacterized protein n=1 Tax=Riccia sorocarpa TaxID=122646 RepID=A0ABD3IAT3_9MARC
MDSRVGRRRRVEKGSKQKQKKAKVDGVVSGKAADTGRTQKQRKNPRDEELLSGSEDEEDTTLARGLDSDEEEDEDVDVETAQEKRLRLAKAYLNKIRSSAKDESEEDEDEGENEEAKRGARDSMVADLLAQRQLEESGRVQRKFAHRVVQSLPLPSGRVVSRRHRQTVTAVCLTEDDSRGFAASKDGLIVQWDIETGQSEKYDWPTVEPSTSGGNGGKSSKSKSGGSKHILAMAVSSDGRYLAAGGLGRRIQIWDTRTKKHVVAFPGHKGAISSLAFRQGTQQLMSGSYDRTIKLWSVDDRSYIDTLYGHQSEVLSIDCLRQERVISASRDRTLRLWKIPEESQLVFRGHAPSMDSCCMLSNTEFFSGSDDGSVALWNSLRKKPLVVVKNAHGTQADAAKFKKESEADEEPENELANGHSNGNGVPEAVENGGEPGTVEEIVGGAASSWVGAVASCRASDLVASGAGDGVIRLWALEEDSRSVKPICSLPVKGFVNSLAFANSGRFLLAGVGQEPRLGRWGRIPGVRNGVWQHTLFSGE